MTSAAGRQCEAAMAAGAPAIPAAPDPYTTADANMASDTYTAANADASSNAHAAADASAPSDATAAADAVASADAVAAADIHATADAHEVADPDAGADVQVSTPDAHASAEVHAVAAQVMNQPATPTEEEHTTTTPTDAETPTQEEPTTTIPTDAETPTQEEPTTTIPTDAEGGELEMGRTHSQTSNATILSTGSDSSPRLPMGRINSQGSNATIRSAVSDSSPRLPMGRINSQGSNATIRSAVSDSSRRLPMGKTYSQGSNATIRSAVSDSSRRLPMGKTYSQGSNATIFSALSNVTLKLKQRDSKSTMASSDASVQGKSISAASAGSASSLGDRVRTQSEDVDDEVKNIASFEGCEELLRGSSLSVILRNRARIFSDSSGSAATYALSAPTKIIDAFISHNWCVPRWQKWICLSFHFNLLKAVALTFIVLSPLGVLSVYGWVPTLQYDFAPYPRSYVYRVATFPVFLVFLCFYGDIVRCFPNWHPIVFLDKTCIHQEDRAIQRRGIEKLGAFLCYSKTMVICYTDIYLMKLWTIYEVASFMTLQSVSQMRVVPVTFPIVFTLSFTCFFVAGTIGLYPEIEFGFYYTMHAFFLANCYGVTVVFRRWGRNKIEIHRMVKSFNARKCVCFCEADRPLVYANIAALMRETQGIGKDADEDAALACFDNLVRDHLFDALISSVGKYSMRYEHAVSIGCTFIVPVLDQLVGLAYGMSWREYCSYALWYAYIAFAVLPVAFMGFSTWVFIPITGIREVLDLLEIWANESNVGLVVFVLFVVTCAAMARHAMHGPTCPSFCGLRQGRANQMLADSGHPGSAGGSAKPEAGEPAGVGSVGQADV